MFLLACTCARSVPEPPPPHYEGVVDLRLSVEAGDLDAFKAAARNLDGDQDEAGGLHGALGFAQVAEDVDDAAFAAARIAEACGACHTGLSTELLPVGDPTAVSQAVTAWDRTPVTDDPLVDVLSSCVECHE